MKPTRLQRLAKRARYWMADNSLYVALCLYLVAVVLVNR